jgi:hypothetical protein
MYARTSPRNLLGALAVVGFGAGYVLLNLHGEKAQISTDFVTAGPVEARQDIQTGKIRYLLSGQPQAHDVLFGQILKADYGITLVSGGCTVSEESRVQAAGYNQVIHEYLKKMSKEDVIKEAEAKARRQWDKENEKAKAGRQ